jgi:hypothetical protein
MTSSLAIGTVILLALVLVTAGWFVLSYRKAHALTAVTMLRPRSHAQSGSIFQPLSIGDAVSHAGADYVVEDISPSFADGETSRMVHLVPRDVVPATSGSPSRRAGQSWRGLTRQQLVKLRLKPSSPEKGLRPLARQACLRRLLLWLRSLRPFGCRPQPAYPDGSCG